MSDEKETSQGVCSKKIIKTSDKRIDEYWHPELPGVKFSVELYFATKHSPIHYRAELVIDDDYEFFTGADMFEFTQLCLHMTWVLS